MFDILAPWVFWLVIAGVLFIVEICTVSFFAFWPGVGAVAAAICALFTDNFVIQSAVFVIVSTIMIVFMKPLAQKFFKTKDVKMNNKALIDKNGIVTQEIDNLNSKGQVKVSGELWSAISEDDVIIEKGATILIKDVKGVKLVVKKV